jgi:hypothetical protein
MLNLVIIYLIVLYISIPGLLNKAGYNFFLGLIPIYNVYLLFRVLEIPLSIIITLLLGLIFLNNNVYVLTLIFVFLPFILADAYSKGKVISIVGLILPMIVFPYLAYAPSALYTYSSPAK